MAHFLVFEGIDACGKSTQLKATADYLTEKGYKVHCVREPGTDPVSEKIRNLVLDPDNKISDMTELLLFSASRSQFARSTLQPLLEEDNNTVVLCDRYIHSTVAYQGYGKDIELYKINTLFDIYLDAIEYPDCLFWYNIPYEVMLERLADAGIRKDRMEANSAEYYRRVILGYEETIDDYASIAYEIDGTQSIESVTKATIKSLTEYFSARGVHW